MLINLRNGVWDARQEKLLEHDPISCWHAGGGELRLRSHRPGWLAFLARVQPDPEVRAYLQRAMGWSMTADMGEQIMFLHHGDGATEERLP